MGNQKEEKKAKPEQKYRAGGVCATVWNNKGKNEETGKEYEFNTINVDRSYKDKKDEWQTTSNFRVNDLPKVVLVAQKAYEYVAMKKKEEKE